MNRRKHKLLIIDDDDRNIFALKAVLTAKGFDCVAATGGLQALDILKEQKDISVALIDMMMPDMDGYELMALVRKISSLDALKMIAVTAQAMPGYKEKCFAAGADTYLSKPVDVDALLQIINEEE